MRNLYLSVFIHCLSLIICYPITASSQEINKEFTHTIGKRSFIKMYDTVSICFIGDIMQHTPQINNALIDKHNPKNQNNYCYDYTFNGIKHYINKADLACANMEFTLAGYPFTGYPQFSAPDKIAVTAKESGINVFLTANNHILDKGLKGLKRTLNIYDSLGVYYTGSYRDSLHELKNNPLIIEKNNIKIGLINFTYGTNGIKVSPPSIVSFMDSTKVKNAIKKAKDLAVDIIIATPHWGEEYHLTQSKDQQNWAKMLFREGVRIIIGSHPHVTQDAFIYKNGNNKIDKFVFYSLGNYISNQSNPNYTQLGMLVSFSLVKDNFSNIIDIIELESEYLWTFKAREFNNYFTVLPIKGIIDNDTCIKDTYQKDRMLDTYNQILKRNQVKEVIDYGRKENYVIRN